MGRAIVVGDENQAIYGFRGADPKSFQRIRDMLGKNGRKVTDRDLPVNYRCDQKIITHAQTWVPAIRGANKALGTVDEILFNEAIDRANNQLCDIPLPDGIDGEDRVLTNTSFAFLCRINLPIIITAYQLIGIGKKVCIIGRNQIGAPLKRIIDDLCGTDPNHPEFTDRITDTKNSDGVVIKDGFLTRLNHYLIMQSEKLKDEKYESKLEALQQNVECLEVIADKVKDDRVQGIRDQIDELFSEEPSLGVISLSSCHRSKGLEFDVVFILRPDLMPHPRAKSADEKQQEINLAYVACTRSRHRLYYVSNWPFGKGKGGLHWNSPFEKVEKLPVDDYVPMDDDNSWTESISPPDDGEPF